MKSFAALVVLFPTLFAGAAADHEHIIATVSDWYREPRMS